MARIENLSKLQGELKRRIASSREEDNRSVLVGYTAAYAVHVHEDLQAYHKVGQAKYLEEPARLLQPELKEMIVKSRLQGRPLSQALLLAGLRLQRESMLLVPVDTGALRASAYTVLE